MQVVHRIGRHFGFQAFNPDPRNSQVRFLRSGPVSGAQRFCCQRTAAITVFLFSQGLSEPVWTPATIFLVTDHLYHLLVKNYMRRDGASGSDDDRFGRAVFRLHDAIFQGYRDWCTHLELPRRVKELELEALQKYGTVVVGGSLLVGCLYLRLSVKISQANIALLPTVPGP